MVELKLTETHLLKGKLPHKKAASGLRAFAVMSAIPFVPIKPVRFLSKLIFLIHEIPPKV